MKFKVGDYVETDWDCAGIKPGEQGIVIEASYQDSLQLMFPARTDHWVTELGWLVSAKRLKLVYRPRQRKSDGKDITKQ